MVLLTERRAQLVEEMHKQMPPEMVAGLLPCSLSQETRIRFVWIELSLKSILEQDKLWPSPYHVSLKRENKAALRIHLTHKSHKTLSIISSFPIF